MLFSDLAAGLDDVRPVGARQVLEALGNQTACCAHSVTHTVLCQAVSPDTQVAKGDVHLLM